MWREPRQKKKEFLTTKTVFDEDILYGSNFSYGASDENNFLPEEELSQLFADKERAKTVAPNTPFPSAVDRAIHHKEDRLLKEAAIVQEVQARDPGKHLEKLQREPEYLLPSFFDEFLGTSPKFVLIKYRLPVEVHKAREAKFTAPECAVWLVRLGLVAFDEYRLDQHLVCKVCGLSEKEIRMYPDPSKTTGDKLERCLKFIKDDGAYADFIRDFELENQTDFEDDVKHLLMERLGSKMQKPTFDFEVGTAETAALLEIYLRVNFVFREAEGVLTPSFFYFTMNFDENHSVE